MGPRLRIWHRRTGAGLLGLFLVLHLVTNASALAGARAYARVVVGFSRSAVYPLVELIVLGALVFHAAVGVALVRRRGAPDEDVERYGDRRLWTLQRAAAFTLAAFLAVHLWELRIQRFVFGLDAGALHTVLTGHLSWTWAGVPWLALFYVVGTGAAAFHFGNGLFAATSSNAQDGGARRRIRAVTVVLGAFLFVIGAATIVGFATGARLLPAPAEEAAPCGPQIAPSR